MATQSTATPPSGKTLMAYQWRHLAMVMLVLLAIFAVQLAHAQLDGSPNASAPGYTTDTSATPKNAGFFAGLALAFNTMTTWVVKSVLGNFADTVKTTSLALANGTQTLALGLAAALATASLIWKVLIDMLGKKGVMGSVIEVAIYATITTTLLLNYPAVVDQVFQLAAALVNAVAPDGTSAIGTYVVTFWDALGRVFTQISNDWSKVGVWDGTVMIVDTIGALFIMIGVIFTMIMSLADIIGVFVMGPVFFGIGIVFGPIMIATLVSDFTRGWFKKWFEFLIGSAMLTVVASVVLVLVSAIVKGSVDKIGIDGNSALMSMIGVAILSLSFSKLFQSVPSITDALFPGRTGASGSISDKMGPAALASAALGTAGVASAMNAAKATPAAVAAAGAKAAGAVIAGLNAKTHMTKALNSAGGGLETAAKVTANGFKSFAEQARSSDAGKAVEGLARQATAHATRSAAVLTGETPPPTSKGAGGPAGTGPGMSMGQVERTQDAFNSNFPDPGKKS